ncbi:hypothetical protein CRM79_21385 [Pantoea agglomerans]|nr:hypothetical protein CRM79_21385 [Pantoea agglomerans]
MLGIVRCANGLAPELMLGIIHCANGLAAELMLGLFAARTGSEKGFVRLISWAVSDTPLQATDKGRQSPRPLTPGSGLLHRRFAVPSLLPDFSRTGRTRHPWREPASSRHPCRSS